MISDTRWHSLITRLSGNPPRADVFRQIIIAYSEPNRHYHNLDHIEHSLCELDAAAGLAESPDELEFAIWLHDVVYDLKASDNEEKSAFRALQILAESGCAGPVRVKVQDLILATKHSEPPTSHDAALIVDIDISIFGQPPEIFDSYERSIRAEYSWVPETRYIAGRCKILSSFLNRPRIYFTERFEKMYSSQAKLNLIRVVAALQQSRKRIG